MKYCNKCRKINLPFTEIGHKYGPGLWMCDDCLNGLGTHSTELKRDYEIFKLFESEISNKKIKSISFPDLDVDERRARFGRNRIPITFEFYDKTKSIILCSTTLVRGK